MIMRVGYKVRQRVTVGSLYGHTSARPQYAPALFWEDNGLTFSLPVTVQFSFRVRRVQPTLP